MTGNNKKSLQRVIFTCKKTQGHLCIPDGPKQVDILTWLWITAMPEEGSDVTKAAPQGPNLGCVVTPVLLALYKCIMSITDTRRSQSKQTR